MKINSLFAASLALVTLVSCQNVPSSTPSSGDTGFSIQSSRGKSSGKSSKAKARPKQTKTEHDATVKRLLDSSHTAKESCHGKEKEHERVSKYPKRQPKGGNHQFNYPKGGTHNPNHHTSDPDEINSNGHGHGWGVCDNNGGYAGGSGHSKGKGKGRDGNEGKGLGNKGCGGPSPSPSATPTPVPTATPTPVPTATPTPVPTATPPLCERRVESASRPKAPVFLIKQNFAEVTDPNFANDLSDPFANWVQWGTDYYPNGNGITPWNPGPTLGDRLQYQEYVDERPNLLEGGIYKHISLVDADGNYTYRPGDKMIAKLNVTPGFTDNDTDTDIGITFYNECTGESVSVYGRPVRGVRTVNHEIYVEAEIPAGMTQVSTSLLVYLGYQEAGSAVLHNVSLEQVPQEYYQTRSIYFNDMSQGGDFGFGANSPLVDTEFGYDFFLVPFGTDKGATAYNSGVNTGATGGMIKRVDLGSYAPGSMLTAKMYSATTFSAGPLESRVHMAVEFYDATDNQIGSAYSTTLTANHYETLVIDRTPIPAGASYVKFVPMIALGTAEVSSAVMDDLSLEIVTPN